MIANQPDEKAEITTSIRREKMLGKFTRLIKNANKSQSVGWLKAKTKTGRAPDGLTQQPPSYPQAEQDQQFRSPHDPSKVPRQPNSQISTSFSVHPNTAQPYASPATWWPNTI